MGVERVERFERPTDGVYVYKINRASKRGSKDKWYVDVQQTIAGNAFSVIFYNTISCFAKL